MAIDQGESRLLSALQRTASSGSPPSSHGSVTGPEAPTTAAMPDAGGQEAMDVDAGASGEEGSPSRQRHKSTPDIRPRPLPSDDDDMPLAAMAARRRRHASAPQERGSSRRKGGTPKRRRSPSPSFVSKLARKKHKGSAQDSEVEEIAPGEESGEETQEEQEYLRQGLEKMKITERK